MSDDPEYWYAARTRANQELSLRNSLEKLKITHYLPTHILFRKVSDRVKRVEIPTIKNLIFIKTTKQNAYAIVKNYALKLYYIKNLDSTLLVVPEKQMIDFMCLMEYPGDITLHCGDYFSTGDRVRVIKGGFSGIEGELVRIEGRSHVLLRISQVIAASVKIPKTYLRKIES